MSSSQLDKVTGRVHRMEKRLTMEKEPPHDRLSVTDLRVDGFHKLVDACRADQADNHRVLVGLENKTGRVERKISGVDDSVRLLRTDGAVMYEDITDILTTQKDMQKKQDRLLGDVGALKEHVVALKDQQADMASDINLFKRGQSDMRADLALLKRNLTATESDILFLRTGQDRLKGDVELLKNDLDLLKEAVYVLKTDVTVLTEAVYVLKTDVTVLTEDVHVLKTDVTVLKEDVRLLKTGQDEILSLLKRVVRKVDPNDN